MAQQYQYDLSIVIPVYKSEGVLPELVAQIENSVNALGGKYKNHEIIFVCDHSPDDSWRIITSLASSHPQVRGILLRVNAGQHNALMAGLARASGEILVTMDDDLQHSPADISLLLRAIEQGSDVAYARFKTRKHALWKIAGSRLNDLVAGYLLRKPKGLYLSPFRAMTTTIRDEIVRYQGPYVYIDGLILSLTRNIAAVDVDHHDRYAGESGYSLSKSMSLWLKMATSFSIMPLRITSILGICLSALGFFMAFIFVLQKLFIDRMPDGWSSLIVTILVVGGAQLLSVGILGEYLGRVLLTLNARPQYVVAKTLGLQESESRPMLQRP